MDAHKAAHDLGWYDEDDTPSVAESAFVAGAAWALRAYADGIGKAREIAGEMTSEWIALAMQEKARQIEEGE